jgi:hypothetical protein
MKTYEKLAMQGLPNLTMMVRNHVWTPHLHKITKGKCPRSINMETEAYIIKYIKQPS